MTTEHPEAMTRFRTTCRGRSSAPAAPAERAGSGPAPGCAPSTHSGVQDYVRRGTGWARTRERRQRDVYQRLHFVTSPLHERPARGKGWISCSSGHSEQAPPCWPGHMSTAVRKASSRLTGGRSCTSVLLQWSAWSLPRTWQGKGMDTVGLFLLFSRQRQMSYVHSVCQRALIN